MEQSATSENEREDYPDVSPLQAAMNLADVIVQSHRDFDPTYDNPTSPTSWKLAPGFVEGTIGGAVALGVLIPIGNALKVSKNTVSLGMYTVAQITLSLYTSFYTGSIYGGRVWLQKLAQLEPSTPSPSADQVCTNARTLKSIRDFPDLQISENPSWLNPHEMVLVEFEKCLKHCRDRNDIHEQKRRQQEEEKEAAARSRSKFSFW